MHRGVTIYGVREKLEGSEVGGGGLADAPGHIRYGSLNLTPPEGEPGGTGGQYLSILNPTSLYVYAENSADDTESIHFEVIDRDEEGRLIAHEGVVSLAGAAGAAGTPKLINITPSGKVFRINYARIESNAVNLAGNVRIETAAGKVIDVIESGQNSNLRSAGFTVPFPYRLSISTLTASMLPPNAPGHSRCTVQWLYRNSTEDRFQPLSPSMVLYTGNGKDIDSGGGGTTNVTVPLNGFVIPSGGEIAAFATGGIVTPSGGVDIYASAHCHMELQSPS